MSNAVEFLILSVLLFIVWFLFFPKSKEKNGFLYETMPVSKHGWGSDGNPSQLIRGYTWTPYSKLLSEFKTNQGVFIDNFRFFKEFVYEAKMNSFFKKRAEKTTINFTPRQLTQGMLIIGKMGGGKTMFYNSILNQRFYNRAVLHDVKQDFIQTFYNKRRDIILNPYDERSWLWDVMSEDEGIIQTFFLEYMNSVMGEKKDFFSASANKRFNEVALEVRTSYKNATSSQKWILFIKALKEMFAEIESGKQKSQKDVKATMEQILEPLEIMAYQMQNPKQKRFTIKEFFEKRNGTKLFLSNVAEYEKALKPLFSAFLACLSQIHVSMPDTKEDFTLYALDEYLTFMENLGDESRKRLHTLIRSKGGILIPAVQYIPTDNKKLQEELTSSAFAWVFFSTINPQTIDILKHTIGDTEYYFKEQNQSFSEGRATTSYQTKETKTNLLTNHVLNGLGRDFSHITFIPQLQVLYKGYTPALELRERNAGFKKRNLDEFYNLKYSNAQKYKLDELSVHDIFEIPMSRVQKYSLYKQYQKTPNKEEFAKSKGLKDVDFQLFFKEFLPNSTVIANKMNLLTLRERYTLASMWESIKDKDDGKELEFIEKYELQGALPDIFKFSKSQIEQVAF